MAASSTTSSCTGSRDDRFLVVPNAANARGGLGEVAERLAGFDATLDDASDRTALIAVQGPPRDASWRRSRTWRSRRSSTTPSGTGQVAGVAAWVARTGYTGEDGFEVFVDDEDARACGMP